ncbi:hypothetical protein FJZ19_02120 [Candidatus Pacearchaeota archaeon]|nr:hypothetical protein [Candidatus Pacearchaeota archaeon]
MKKITALSLTLAGILGLAGSVSFMNHAFERQRTYSQIVPARVEELAEEAKIMYWRYGNVNIDFLAEHPEVLDKYKRIMQEQKTYLDNPEIKKAVEDYDAGKIERVISGSIGFGSGILTLAGVCGIFSNLKKKK